MKKTKTRTNRQSRALHLMFQQLADELTESGYDMKRTLRADIDIPWTKENVKEFLFRPVMRAQLGKESTTDLTTTEIDQVVNTLTKYLGERTGVEVHFPSIEDLIEQYLEEKK